MSGGAVGLGRIALRLGDELDGERVQLDPSARRLVARAISTEEVALAVRLAGEEKVSVSVGVTPVAPPPEGASPRLHLDTSRLLALLHLDESSLLVHAQAGMRLDVLAGRLAAAGMSLGALPAPSLGRTVGALLSAPRPSEATPRARFTDLCAALDAVLPDGTVVSTRLAPRKASGPEITAALIGARGRSGVIVSAWLRATRRPPRRAFLGFAFSGGAPALAAARRLLDAGARPTDLLVADALAAPDAAALERGEVLLALHLDGTPEVVTAEEALAAELCSGARPLGAAACELAFSGPRFAVRGEVFVPAPALPEIFAARPRPSLLCGFTAAGAALLCPVPRPAAPAAANDGQALRDALFRRLDPAGLFDNAG